MKTIAKLLVLSCILYLVSLPSVFAAPAIQHWTTANGARVYYVHAPELPMVDIQFIFDGGSARDGDHPGVALLTNALLDQGAGELDADAIAGRLEGVGARLSTSAHRDMAIIGLRSLTDEALLQPALEVLELILGQPRFPASALERERKRMLVALQAKAQDPGDIAQKAFFRALYGKHPYATPSLGTEQSLRALSRDDVSAHHRRYYVAHNAVVAVVGALPRAQVEALVEKLAAVLPAGDKAPPLPPVPPLNKAVERH
ncbi:MAG: M16 family metallopeptidase, partial [Gammaproteobacteria bacterium]